MKKRKRKKKKRIYCKLNFQNPCTLSLRRDIRVYLDYPEVRNLMRIVLPFIKIRLP
jgi:hypothetical protein